MVRKIAFIKRGSFSHINASVASMLQRHFPKYEVTVTDVDQLLRRHRLGSLFNLFHIFQLYGGDIARRRRTVQQCYHRTPFMFSRIKTLLADHFRRDLSSYAFSFQTQSLYDASVNGLPHFVYTDHTHLANLYYPGFVPTQVFAREWIELEKSLYHRAAKNFTMSRHIQRSLLEQYGCDPGKVACVYAGSNTDTRPVPLENDNYRNKTILFIGVDWDRKGGPELAAAFKIVRQHHPDAKLIIVGCSPKLDLPNCEIAGRVPLERVKDYYARSSIFCLPTRLEPFGIVFVESLLNKIPIVATNIGALPDIVEDGKSGRLVASHQVGELAAALLELLADPEKCRRFGEYGHQAVRERYSWDAVGARIRTEIEAILGPSVHS